MASVLHELRQLVPRRGLTHTEGVRVAELQANHFVDRMRLVGPPVLDDSVTALPKIRVVRDSPVPVSALTCWNRTSWLVILNDAEPLVRQRYSLFHEYHHIVTKPFERILFPPLHGLTSHDRREQAANYFAACVLMPKRWVKRDWGNGIQNLRLLARRYGVSQAAMRVRLLQLGLMQPEPRCGHLEAIPAYRRAA